jgi:hypothetical protein
VVLGPQGLRIVPSQPQEAALAKCQFTYVKSLRDPGQNIRIATGPDGDNMQAHMAAVAVYHQVPVWDVYARTDEDLIYIVGHHEPVASITRVPIDLEYVESATHFAAGAI